MIPGTLLGTEEILEASFEEINASLADELMEEIMKLTPTDFEALVVKLLLKMGYGSGIYLPESVHSHSRLTASSIFLPSMAE